jgi:hypothetical protein
MSAPPLPPSSNKFLEFVLAGTPIYAGMLVDVVDLLTPSSVGVMIGMPAGAAVRGRARRPVRAATARQSKPDRPTFRILL